MIAPRRDPASVLVGLRICSLGLKIAGSALVRATCRSVIGLAYYFGDRRGKAPSRPSRPTAHLCSFAREVVDSRRHSDRRGMLYSAFGFYFADCVRSGDRSVLPHCRVQGAFRYGGHGCYDMSDDQRTVCTPPALRLLPLRSSNEGTR